MDMDRFSPPLFIVFFILLLTFTCFAGLSWVALDVPRDLPDATGWPRVATETPSDSAAQPPDVGFRDSMLRWNEALQLRPDFVIRLKIRLGQMYPRVALAVHQSPGKATAFDRRTVVALLWYQKNHGLEQTGIVDAATRVHIEENLFGEAGFGMVIGEYLEPGDVLIEGVHDARDHRIVPVDAGVYARFRDIVEHFGGAEESGGGVFLDAPGAVNALAIRGARLENGRVVRGDGPRRYHDTVVAPTASWMPDVRERNARYFFAGIPYASGTLPDGDVYDDVLLTAWRDARGQYFVQARPMSVDPSMIYFAAPTDGVQEEYDGTAHLREGQYLYHLEAHTTHYLDHVAAILAYKFPRTETGFSENPGLPLLKTTLKLRNPATGNANHLTINRYVMPRLKPDFASLRLTPRELRLMQTKAAQGRQEERSRREWAILGLSYTALVPSLPIEVIRENLTTHNGILEAEEIEASRGLAACTAIDKSPRAHPRLPCIGKVGNDALVRFRDIDGSIHLNIHASADDRVFSTGCQTIPIAFYHDFLREVSASTSWNVPYMLIDSSRIAGRP